MKNVEIDTSLKLVLEPIWKLYTDPSINSICIDGFDDVYYYQGSEAKSAKDLFKSSMELDLFIQKIIEYSLIDISDNLKSLCLNLDLYTRVHIVLPPVSIKGPSVILTKIPLMDITLSDLIKFNALDEEGKKIIEKAIKDQKGILVVGNPGSGRTTILTTLIESIPQPQRIVTLERFAELNVKRSKVCRLQPPNQKAIEMVELVSMAERMQADYLILSNCDGPEVMPYLELIRNNCNGMASIIGVNPLDGLKRLETKAVLSSEGMSIEDARYAISQSFGFIIFQENRPDGKRLISSIGEIQYVSGELKLKIIYSR